MELVNFKPKKLSGKYNRVQGRILCSIQVAKVGNPHFPSELSIYRIGANHFAILHSDERVPSYDEVLYAEEDDYYKVKVSRNEALVIVGAVQFWSEHKSKHLNPYTILYTHCKLNGVDLNEMKILKI